MLNSAAAPSDANSSAVRRWVSRKADRKLTMVADRIAQLRGHFVAAGAAHGDCLRKLDTLALRVEELQIYAQDMGTMARLMNREFEEYEIQDISTCIDKVVEA